LEYWSTGVMENRKDAMLDKKGEIVIPTSCIELFVVICLFFLFKRWGLTFKLGGQQLAESTGVSGCKDRGAVSYSFKSITPILQNSMP
jgi:hypothetical protein